MPRNSVTLILNDGDYEYLRSLIKQRTIQAQVVIRAHILLDKANGITVRDIARIYDLSTNTVRLCIDKYKEGGTDRALFDDQRKDRPVEITDDAIAWMIDTACQRPVALGYSQKLWTLKNLRRHIRNNAEAACYPRLKTMTRPCYRRTLKDPKSSPSRSSIIVRNATLILRIECMRSWWFTNRFPCSLMKKVILLFRMISPWFIQFHSLAATSDDPRPEHGSGCVYRDYEYKRLGTLLLIAGIDFLTGEAIPVVSESHKSSDFICLLKKLDVRYPEGDVIRIICDNHSAHKSKEVRNYFATRLEERFVFVFTPTHGSWLNLIEGFFSKMTKQMLKGIRVNSKEELANRKYLYFNQVNRELVVYYWTYKMDEISVEEATV